MSDKTNTFSCFYTHTQTISLLYISFPYHCGRLDLVCDFDNNVKSKQTYLRFPLFFFSFLVLFCEKKINVLVIYDTPNCNWDKWLLHNKLKRITSACLLCWFLFMSVCIEEKILACQGLVLLNLNKVCFQLAWGEIGSSSQQSITCVNRKYLTVLSFLKIDSFRLELFSASSRFVSMVCVQICALWILKCWYIFI